MIKLITAPNIMNVEVSTKTPFEEIGRISRFAHGISPDQYYKEGLQILKDDVFSVAEHIIIDIECEISERLARQINRHRHMSLVQKSTRYNDYIHQEEIKFYIPKNIDTKLLQEYYEKMIEQMKKLDNEGVSAEQINYLLPLSTITKVHYKMNLRTLIHMCQVRLCKQALPEFNEFLELLKEYLKNFSIEWDTIVKQFLVPHCIAFSKSCQYPEKKCIYQKK